MCRLYSRAALRTAAAGILIPISLLVIGCTSNTQARLEREAARGVWNLDPGDRLTYDVEYESDAYSNLQALYGSMAAGHDQEPLTVNPHVYHVGVVGKVELTAIERDGSTMSVSYRLLDAKVTAESETGPLVDVDRVSAELAHETFYQIDPEGRFNALVLDPASSDATGNIVRTVVAAMQFVKAQGQTDDWEINEEDTSGRYRSAYKISNEKNSNDYAFQEGVHKYQKTKREYLTGSNNTSTDLPEAPKTVVPAGSRDILFNLERGRIEKIAGREDQSIVIAGKTVGGAQNSLQLKLIGADKAAPAEVAAANETRLSRMRTVQPISLSSEHSQHDQLVAMYRAQLGNDSFDTIRKQLQVLEGGSEKVTPSQIYSKLKALIYVEPDKCASIGAAMLASDPNGQAAELMRTALSAVGSSEAQAALIDSIKSRGNRPDSFQLIVALGSVNRPTPAAEEMMEEVAWQPWGPANSKAARLGLGSIARKLKPYAAERSASIVRLAIAHLHGLDGSESELIGLLGNSGSEEALPVLEEFLRDPSAGIRASSALALRFIDGGQTDELLSKTLAADPDEPVRVAACEALESRDLTEITFAAERRALLTDSSETVRLTLMKDLWTEHEAYPEIAPLLRELASSDQSSQIRDLASQMVTGE